MEFFTFYVEKKSTIYGDTSSDLGDSLKREALSSDFRTETEASDSCDVKPPDRGVFHPPHGSPRILRPSKRGHPRKEYGKVSIIMNCFETSRSFHEALTGPNKVA
ncbi:hypothetical protein NPIL_449421 [Nephila pilipes]|uniref:Uncharacterized protein n=1 Tax=Nephila pilipes TaxID=299642 RepID=A0A8X6MLX0_NEPPI|nr:hypothetical protein NPIL_449421 [Nephila pilipes]